MPENSELAERKKEMEEILKEIISQLKKDMLFLWLSFLFCKMGIMTVSSIGCGKYYLSKAHSE